MLKGFLDRKFKNSLINNVHLFGFASVLFLNIFIPTTIHTESLNKPFSMELDDHIIVVKNNTVIFEYLEQADVKGPIQIHIVDSPKYGEVLLNEDYTFGYKPSPDLCEVVDEFSYLMTNSGNSTKVTVSIDVLCESLTIFNGIAKNEEDSKLENFKILGVENYPNNVLHIFDNEGTEIYKVHGYLNKWSGDVDSSEHLIKENLYYYVFNDGKGNYYSGYLMKN